MNKISMYLYDCKLAIVTLILKGKMMKGRG